MGISLPAEDLLAAQEGLCSIELFSEGNGITVTMHAMSAYGGMKIQFHSFLTLRHRDETGPIVGLNIWGRNKFTTTAKNRASIPRPSSLRPSHSTA